MRLQITSIDRSNSKVSFEYCKSRLNLGKELLKIKENVYSSKRKSLKFKKMFEVKLSLKVYFIFILPFSGRNITNFH